MTTQTFGKYVVTARLGRGGMAEVYEARDPLLDRRVAIKAIHPHLATEAGFGERFRREAKLVASLRHPHIVQLYDFDVANSQPFMVMEYLDGGTLKERLARLRARGETLPLGEIARLLERIADALDYAHAHGAIHRDIKPANILFTPRNEPVLTDFGVAKILGETVQVSVTSGIIGTPAYLSPEQASSRPVDARSDLYSLGVVLYETATGRVPFEGDSPTAVMMQHLTEPPPPPRELNPNLPEAVQAVILKALAKDAADRFASAGDLARAFSAALRGEAPAVEAPPSSEAPTLVGEQTEAGQRTAGAKETPSTLPPARLPSRLLTLQQWLQNRLSLLPVILASLGILLGSLQVSRLEALLPASLDRVWAWLVVLLFAGSAVASLLALLRAASRRQRWQSAAMLALAAVLGLAWTAWFPSRPSAVPRGFVIAIGEFDGSQATRRVDFARRIFEQLQNELSEVGGAVDIVRTRETYPDSETARARGRDLQATLVIWGWYDDAGVSPHVEGLEIPSLEREFVNVPLLLAPASAAEPGALAGPGEPSLRNLTRFVRVPKTIPDFDLFVENGPRQMTYISTALLGLAFYFEGDSERALTMFDKALANAPAGGGETVGLEVVYFQRATVLYQQNQSAEAAEDLQQAITIKPDLFEAHYNLALIYAEVCSPARPLDRAIAEAETAVRLKPAEASAHLLLGNLYRQVGQHQQAIAEFQTALELDPKDADAYGLLADALAAAGQTEAMQAARQEVIALRERTIVDPSADPVHARLALGDAYLSVGEYEKALAEYLAAQGLAPDDPDVHRELGNAYYAKNELDLAEREYQAWASVAPNDPAVHFILGLLHDEQGKPEQAIAELKQAVTLSPCDASAHLSLAGLYWEQGDYAEAAAEYQSAVTIDPQNADALYLLGVTRYLLGQTEAAAESLEAAVALRTDFAEAHYALGQTYFNQQAYYRAASEWELATKLAPDDPANYVALGNVYRRLEGWDEAAAAYQKALTFKDDASTHRSLGQVYFQQRKYEAAVAEYQKALMLEPQNTLAYFGLGDAYAAQGKLEEAVAAYQQALALGENAALHSKLAEVYARQGKTEEAAAQYLKAIALDPQDWFSRLRLGLLYSQVGKLDEAAEQYRAALSIKSDSAEAHYGLALVEYKRCNLSTAGQEANTAALLAPDLAMYRGLLAAVHEAQGRSQDAAQVYAEFQAASASDALAHFLAGDYLFRTGKLDDAAREFQQVLETPNLVPVPASAAHNALGQVYYEQSNLMLGESEFRLALSTFRSNAEAQARLGDIALRAGDAISALAAYEQATAMLPEYGQQMSADNASFLAVNLEVRRGIALGRQGKGDEAKAALDRALALAQGLVSQTPQWAQAHFALAVVYLARGEKSKADTEFAAATQCDQSLALARARVEADLAKLR